MKINEAARIASSSGKSILLNRDGMAIHLLLTNTTSAVIESLNDGQTLVYWHPTLSDLLSSNWEVADDFRINPLPSEGSGPTGTPAMKIADVKRLEHLKSEWYRTK